MNGVLMLWLGFGGVFSVLPPTLFFAGRATPPPPYLSRAASGVSAVAAVVLSIYLYLFASIVNLL